MTYFIFDTSNNSALHTLWFRNAAIEHRHFGFLAGSLISTDYVLAIICQTKINDELKHYCAQSWKTQQIPNILMPSIQSIGEPKHIQLADSSSATRWFDFSTSWFIFSYQMDHFFNQRTREPQYLANRGSAKLQNVLFLDSFQPGGLCILSISEKMCLNVIQCWHEVIRSRLYIPNRNIPTLS